MHLVVHARLDVYLPKLRDGVKGYFLGDGCLTVGCDIKLDNRLYIKLDLQLSEITQYMHTL